MMITNKVTRVTGATEVLVVGNTARLIAIIPETAVTNSTLAIRDASAISGGSTPILTVNSLTGGLVGRQGIFFGSDGVQFGNGITATVGTTTGDVWLVIWAGT